jgi:hypothetical protein
MARLELHVTAHETRVDVPPGRRFVADGWCVCGATYHGERSEVERWTRNHETFFGRGGVFLHGEGFI